MTDDDEGWLGRQSRGVRRLVLIGGPLVVLVGFPLLQLAVALAGADLLVRLVLLLPPAALVARLAVWARGSKAETLGSAAPDVLPAFHLSKRDVNRVKSVGALFRRSLPERLHPAARAYAQQELDKGVTPWPRLLIAFGVTAWLLLVLYLAVFHDVAGNLFTVLSINVGGVYQERSTRRWRRALAEPRLTGTS